jgi:hypothetical protein
LFENKQFSSKTIGIQTKKFDTQQIQKTVEFLLKKTTLNVVFFIGISNKLRCFFAVYVQLKTSRTLYYLILKGGLLKQNNRCECNVHHAGY